MSFFSSPGFVFLSQGFSGNFMFFSEKVKYRSAVCNFVGINQINTEAVHIISSSYLPFIRISVEFLG